MNHSIYERVYVTLDEKSKPSTIVWKNRFFEVNKIGFHHTYKVGETLFHVFSVTTPNLFFRLELDTTNLQWVAKEISAEN